MSLSVEQKKEVILRVLDRHPRFEHSMFRENIEAVAAETQVVPQEINGQKFTTLFLTHNTMPSLYKSDPAFSLGGAARFFKSVTVDADDEIISIGVPHFFNLENFKSLEGFSQWAQSFRFVEKHDGTCFLVTRWRGQYLIRSRRRIYQIADDLSCLNFPGYELGSRLESLCRHYGPDGHYTILMEAIFPHPALRPVRLPEFYNTVMRGAGFCPYVDYPAQDNFLTGLVFHDDLRFERQTTLDELASGLGLKRPKTLSFNSLEDAGLWLKRATNHEGFCVYFNDDQAIFKFKTRWYQRVRSTTGEIFHLLHPSGDFARLHQARSQAGLVPR